MPRPARSEEPRRAALEHPSVRVWLDDVVDRAGSGGGERSPRRGVQLLDELARHQGIGQSVEAVVPELLRDAALDEREVGHRLPGDRERAREHRDPLAVVEGLVERHLEVTPLARARLVLEREQVVARVGIPLDADDVAIGRDSHGAFAVDEGLDRSHRAPRETAVVAVRRSQTGG